MGETAFLFPGQGARGLNEQASIFLTSLDSYRLYLQSRKNPAMMVGHSLGEFSALVALGVLDFQIAGKLIAKRQILMDKACRDHQGWMMAIFGPLEPLELICGDLDVQIACYNAPNQHVISGKILALQRVLSELGKAGGGYRAKTLNVSGAFHSRLMAEANERFGCDLQQVEFAEPQLAYYSTVTGDRIDNPREIKAAMMEQMVKPVLFEKAIRSMIRDGATIFAEMEPAGVLTRLVEQIRKGE